MKKRSRGCSQWLVVLLIGVAVLVPTVQAEGTQDARTGQAIQPNATWEQVPVAARPAIAAALGREHSQYTARRSADSLRLENREHGVAADFRRGGVEVRSGTSRFGLALRAYGYGDVIEPVASAAPTSAKNRVEYRRGALTEWYVNGPLGLEQGFTIANAPGKSNGRPLTLALDLAGDLAPVLDATGRGLALTRGGATVLRYTQLVAYDVDGRELRAWLELRGGELLVRVDDAGARYPIVVDPQFVRGPAVRVNPNEWVEFIWRADVAWRAYVEIFDNPDATGTALVKMDSVDGGGSRVIGTQHVVRLSVLFLAPDTGYFFRITMTDPFGGGVPLETPTPLPSFFTGTQPPGADPEQPKLTASDGAADDHFGISLAISGDTVVVGAPSADSIEDTIGFREGAAYVFVKPEGGWATTTTFAARLIASDATRSARFGTSVAIDGDTVLVGAPSSSFGSVAAYVFVKPENGWAGDLNETAKLTASGPAAQLGASVAIDGDTVVVGDDWDDFRKGSAYVFMKPAGGWTGHLNETARLTASDGEVPDGFGHSVAVSGDTVVVGAPHDDIDGIPDQGSAYVFVKPASGWGDTGAFAAKLIGEPGDPSYPFSYTLDQFGTSVAISGDTVAVGAPGDDFGDMFDFSFDQGSAYVFVKAAGGWEDTSAFAAKLTVLDGEEWDEFGTSVAMSGDSLLIGAPGAEDAGGSAYLFVKPEDGWAGNVIEPARLTASDGASFDLLGSSVAINGDTMMLGAYADDALKGSAYVFTGATAPTDSTAPTITLTTPPEGAVYTLNQMVNTDYSCQDEADGSGLASCVGTADNGAPLNTATVGARTFTVMAADNAGNPASLSHTYSVVYDFGGFFPPIDNLPTLNRMRAGAAAPVKFSLAGYHGLGIFAPGYPTSIRIPCDSSASVDAVDQTVTTGSSGLSYDAETDVYTYVWKTEKSWTGSCRQLVVMLGDGTIHRVNFTFD